jgi:hypothetical protein
MRDEIQIHIRRTIRQILYTIRSLPCTYTIQPSVHTILGPLHTGKPIVYTDCQQTRLSWLRRRAGGLGSKVRQGWK